MATELASAEATASEWVERLAAEEKWEAWYAAWKQEREIRHARTREMLTAALDAGREVIEDAYHWQATWPSPHYSARGEALVEHLMNRHLGFGWMLVIDGERRCN